MIPLVSILVLLAVMSEGALSSQIARAADATEVGRWSFDSEEAAPFDLNGEVERDQSGPRPPEYPAFADNNTALRFGGAGYLVIQDANDEDAFDFTNGDSMTLEAWVKLDAAHDGHLMYVIGKGRTGRPDFARDNQNWAMRVVKQHGVVKVSFLFATKFTTDQKHWHRWISTKGFDVETGWHHVAVAYEFGKPESIRGWIDGQPTDGRWDMGGPTPDPPVVDEDDVWIGSSRGGSSSNSFRGFMDEVAIHRKILDDKTVASRFQRVGGPQLEKEIVVKPQAETMPVVEGIPAGKVLFTLGENLPSNSRWLNEGESWPDEMLRWTGESFLLPRVPVCFGEGGLRDAWKSPVLVRMAGQIELPAGEHRVLLRARSLSRLWFDDQIIARTIKNPHKRSNLEPIVPVAEPPFEGGREVAFPQQEVFGELSIEVEQGQPNRGVDVVLELVVGGQGYRTESGEVCVAIQPNRSGPFYVLSPRDMLPLIDAAVEPALEQIEQSLVNLEDKERRATAAPDDAFWSKRHQAARAIFAAETPPPNQSPSNPVDHFIAKKIQLAVAAANEHDQQTRRQFHEQVLPILSNKCFRCHGEKDKGGLRLNSREAALRGGESELPAVVPGEPEDSELLVLVRDGVMPPTDEGLTEEQIQTLEAWIAGGAAWPPPPLDQTAITPPAIADEASLLRRIYLDIVGVPPTYAEAQAFFNNPSPTRVDDLVEMLLTDDRYADHWISMWLDLLAENPTLLNVSLGSTGPFRWFLYDALRDNMPADRMVTELIRMRGDAHHGGSAGFAIAGENDAPMAAKAHILASSLLGIELQCARCHDSPYHSTTQEDLYSLAAMLQRRPVTPPATSRVPKEFFENQTRASLIRVTLPPDQPVAPKWPFAGFTGVTDSEQIEPFVKRQGDSRERLAALFTSPYNKRFPRVIVNHLWKRLMGAGIVEPVQDWEGKSPSHPELLDWLATELVTHDYDLKHILQLVMTSDAYRREPIGNNLSASAEQRFFAAPDRRRMSAEQIVDSLFVASGQEMDVEELTFVHDGVHPMNKRLTLGKPKRAWMFAGLNNERDRPSLALPKAQAIVDVLAAFGWTGTRQQPIPVRENDPNVLQPGVLANGHLTMALTRAAFRSDLAELALQEDRPESLVDTLFVRFLTRKPTAEERAEIAGVLADGFAERFVPKDKFEEPEVDPPLPQATWTNHLLPEANEIQLEIEQRVRRGPAADPRLTPAWRSAYEDFVWSLVNHREFVWIP